MNEVLISAGLGIIGGGVRVLIGYLKHIQLKQKPDKTSLLVYTASLLVIGAFSGIVLGYGKVLSFLGGYAGIDLMEGYYRTFMKKSVKMK